MQSGIAAVIPGGMDRQMAPAPSPAAAAFGGGGGGGGAAAAFGGFGGGAAAMGVPLNAPAQIAAAVAAGTANALPSLNSLTGDLGFG